MFRFRMDGFDDAIRKLKRLEKNAKELSGTHELPMSDLFDSSFMHRYTKVPSFDALVSAGGHQVESSADFADQAWEAVVQAHTQFHSWQEMREKAVEEYTSRRLTEGV
jgi:hypothetical protein